VQQFLLNNQNSTILQPPYSSDFTPYSFWLYLRPKNVLKVCCFHMQQRSTECDDRFHSHAERTLLEVPTVMTELDRYVCICLCVCAHVHTHTIESELCILVLEIAGRVTTYLVFHLIERSVIWCVKSFLWM
jgi:hypothetical protein